MPLTFEGVVKSGRWSRRILMAIRSASLTRPTSATSSTISKRSEQLGPGRLRFTDAQRRRLAAKAKTLSRRVLRDLATIVTPDTLLDGTAR
jgi:hypothetical protein